MSGQRHVLPGASEAAAACARNVAVLLREAQGGNSEATLAVSGGSTPKLMFDALAQEKLDWNRVHLFWVDERAVPPASPQSNYGMTEQHLIRPARIPRRNVHRIEAERGAQVAARLYAEDIRRYFILESGELPHFDVLLCGIGADGHTASLFPGEPLVEDREGIAAAVFVAKLDQWRITLLPGALLAARHTGMLITGADKCAALKNVVSGAYDPLLYPAQVVAHHGRRVHWFLDEAAAAGLD